jgi:hypothetical protein
VTLKDAFFLIKTDNDEYSFIKSPLAYHDLDKNIIQGDFGIFETYSSKSNGMKPFETIQMNTFKYQIGDNKSSFEAEEMEINK